MTEAADPGGVVVSAERPADARATVELAHAVVVDAAATAGVPFLVLKGLGAQHHGLQDTERVPADVDVLVPPSRVVHLAAELGRRGWRTRAADADDLTFSSHSSTLYRPGWSCDVDLHGRFPGFGPDADAAFRYLWATRATIVVAGVAVPVPGYDAAVLVQALHCLRSPTVERHRREYEQLVVTTGRVVGVDPGSCGAVVETARALGALPAARPFLVSALGVELDDWGVPDLRWRLLTAAASPTGRRVLAFLEAPWRDRLRVVRVAVAPPRETLEKGCIGYLAPLGLVAAYARRVRRGVRSLPSAVREAVDAHRQR